MWLDRFDPARDRLGANPSSGDAVWRNDSLEWSTVRGSERSSVKPRWTLTVYQSVLRRGASSAIIDPRRSASTVWRPLIPQRYSWQKSDGTDEEAIIFELAANQRHESVSFRFVPSGSSREAADVLPASIRVPSASSCRPSSKLRGRICLYCESFRCPGTIICQDAARFRPSEGLFDSLADRLADSGAAVRRISKFLFPLL